MNGSPLFCRGPSAQNRFCMTCSDGRCLLSQSRRALALTVTFQVSRYRKWLLTCWLFKLGCSRFLPLCRASECVLQSLHSAKKYIVPALRAFLQSIQPGKLRVAYPIIKRLLIHTPIVMKTTNLFHHHAILCVRGLQSTENMAYPICVDCRW